MTPRLSAADESNYPRTLAVLGNASLLNASNKLSDHPMASAKRSYFVGVVDDEPGVRNMLGRLFDSANVEVHTYDSGEDLLATSSEQLALLACLVLDIGLA